MKEKEVLLPSFVDNLKVFISDDKRCLIKTLSGETKFVIGNVEDGWLVANNEWLVLAPSKKDHVLRILQLDFMKNAMNVYYEIDGYLLDSLKDSDYIWYYPNKQQNSRPVAFDLVPIKEEL